MYDEESVTAPVDQGVDLRVRPFFSHKKQAPAPREPLSLPTTIAFWLILLVTAVICLRWSDRRLFWVDELLEFYSDTKPSLAQVIRDQMHAPFSLEPPCFHVLLYLVHRILPWPKLAARLPSIVALLITEACSFRITYRITRSGLASLVAMLLPMYLVTSDYGVESRAYGTLTACVAVALLCWIRLATEQGQRALAVAGMTLALAAAVLMHFYGVVLLVPFLCAELIRTWERRRLDWPVAGGLLAALATVALDLPFERAMAPFRLHYYNTGETSWANIPFTYAWFYEHFEIYSFRDALVTRVGTVACCFVAVLVGISVWRAKQEWRSGSGLASVEAVLSMTALLPVLNLVVAQVTRAYVPRYSLPAVVGISVLTAVLARNFLVVPRVQVALACFLGYGSVAYMFDFTRLSHDAQDEANAHLGLTQEQSAELARLPDQHIYIQNLARFLFVHYYVPGDLNRALTAVYSQPCELQWARRDPSSLFAGNIQRTTTIPVTTFAQLEGSAGPHMLVLYHEPREEWIESELHAEKVEVKPLGYAFGGDLVEVNLPQASTCDPATRGKR